MRNCNRNCNTNSFNRTNSLSCDYSFMNNNSNNCIPNNVFPSNYLYGHAYTPNQIMNKTFDPETGLQNGTIFPELVSPYFPGQSIEFINYLRSGGCM